MMHPLIHTELARAADADIERRTRAARAQEPTVRQARRHHWRIARRRLVLGLARPAKAAR